MMSELTVVAVGSSGWEAVRALPFDLDAALLGWLPSGLVDVRDARHAVFVELGSDADLVRARLRRALADVTLPESSIVALVGDLESPSSAGAMPVLAEAFARHNTAVIALVTEGCSPTSKLALQCLTEHAGSVIVEDQAESLALATRTLLGTRECGILGIDPDTVCEVIRQEGRIGFAARAAASGAGRARAAAHACADALPVRARERGRRFVVRIAGAVLRMREIETAVYELAGRLPNDAAMVFSAVINPRLSHELEVGVLALGVKSLPGTQRCT